MTLFPDIIGEELTIEPSITVEEQELGELYFVRYRKWLRPRYSFTLGYSLLSPTEARSIADHVKTHAGNVFEFDWFLWSTLTWLWVPIGIGDGTTTQWTIPGKSTTAHEFFTGTSTAVSGTVAAGLGTDGADRVTISPAVANGVPLWAHFRGRRRFTVAYESNDQPQQRNADSGQYTFSTKLVQMK